MREHKPTAPVVTLLPGAYADIPEPTTQELQAASELYLIISPNRAGLAMVGTSPTGSAGIMAFVDAKYIQK